MTRDETVALFLQGREAWNAWAEKMLAERRAMEADNRWGAERKWGKILEPKNEETRAWMDAANTDFSRCRFLVRKAEGTEEAAGEPQGDSAAPAPAVKSISLDVELIDFKGFVFPGDVSFESAAFAGAAYFRKAAFKGDANFRSAAFSGYADFQSAAFSRDAAFPSATFTGNALFVNATFTGDAYFWRASFTDDAYFWSATFEGYAGFQSATFTHNGDFSGAQFKGRASFYALRVERGFDIAGAVFEAVPDFIQAHFEEAPRLDNVKVIGRTIAQHPRPEREKTESRWLKRWRAARYAGGGLRSWPGRAVRGAWERVRYADADIPSRWRALKRLAIQGHDTDQELEFHAREVRSQRFADDWPLPLAFWRGMAWGGFFRFWFGIFYQIASDFGRSLARPFAFWALCIAIFAVYFLGQNGEMTMRRDHHYPGWLPAISEYTRTAWKALRSPPYCYPGTPPKLDEPRAPEKRPDDIQTGFSGLVEEVRAETNLVNEALSIAYHNAVIILDSSGDSAHRAFGCLYGVERYGGNPVAYVPRSVAIASGIQKLLSAIFIFLFGLAVRNMLKMK